MVVEPYILLMFLAATYLLVLTPGPVVSLIIAETLTYGPRNGFAVAFGAVTVAALFLLLYVAGAAPLLMALPDWAYDGIRYAGAAFLLYMGWSMIRAAKEDQPVDTLELEASASKAYKKAVLTAAANPKAFVFFAAFFPQFVDMDKDLTPQLGLLAVVFLFASVSGDCIWVVFAAKARQWLSRQGGTRLISRISGSALALGAVLLLIIN